MTTRSRRTVSCLLATLFVGTLLPAQSKWRTPSLPEAPAVPAQAFFRPTFRLAGSTFSAGSAFVVRWNDREKPVVLTAWHLFGPAGGLEAAIPFEQFDERVRDASLAFDDPPRGQGDASKDARERKAGKNPKARSKPKKPLRTGPPIPIPLMGSMEDDKALAGDTVAFETRRAEEVRRYALPLAEKAPRYGAFVWMFGEVLGGAPRGQRLHPARCEGIDEDGYLTFRYLNPKLKLRATSGAAILNEKGEVVGVNYGGALQDDGSLYGFANPVDRFRKRLLTAVHERRGAEKNKKQKK